AAPRGEQLMLPLPQFHGGVDLGPRPRLGRDGQYQLPIPAERIARPTPPRNSPVPKPAPGTRTRPAKQLAFDVRPPDPYRGNRPARNGQYPLPIPVPKRKDREPVSADPPPPPTPPGSAPKKGRQL